MKYATVTEGKTRLRVPSVSLENPEPPTFPVFFNPAAAVNRDISVAVAAATSGEKFCDLLSGIGARGVRVARELGRDIGVTLVDFNEISLRLARQNARLNRVEDRCRAVSSEANRFAYSRFGRDAKFDYMDVDPFGTPVPFVPAALRATADQGILSVTATDTAVLCGVYHTVCERRYGSASLNNHFKHETGVRILMSYVRRIAASLDVGVSPIFAHSTRHYMRIFARIEVGPSKADHSLKYEGFIALCSNCGHVDASPERARGCGVCGAGKVRIAGPLWIGGLADEAVSRKAAACCRFSGFDEAAEVIVSVAAASGLPPFGYSLEEICSSLRTPSVSEQAVVDSLRSRGHRCQRQPFEKVGLKSTAPYREVVEAVKEAAVAAKTHRGR